VTGLIAFRLLMTGGVVILGGCGIGLATVCDDTGQTIAKAVCALGGAVSFVGAIVGIWSLS
jgi:hypothetical protein